MPAMLVSPSHAPKRAGFVLTMLFAACSMAALAQEAQPVQTVQTNPGFMERIADPQFVSPSFSGLLESEREWTINMQRTEGVSFTPDDWIPQDSFVADWDWVDNSGYAFDTEALGAQGIGLLSGFSSLPQNVLDANLAIVTQINNNSPESTKQHAMVDAFGYNFLYFPADALGPRLGYAFIQAYNDGRLAKAAALIKRSELSTDPSKNFYAYPRPFAVDGNSIQLVADTHYVFSDNHVEKSTGWSFPSGHTNMGVTDTLLLAEMIPERFAALVARGDGYGYNRQVLGVHYPLDVIGGRMHAEFAVSHYLNDPAYRTLFNQARDELRAALTAYCGMPLDQCAAPGDGESDPWASEAARAFHDYTMNYGLPAPGRAGQPMMVPEGAEVLLEAALPKLNAEQRRALLEQTAEPSGEVLDQNNGNGSWQRLNLLRAYEAGSQQ